MKEISHGVEIEAPAERVWRVLTDFPRLPEWSPFVKSIAGDVAAGNRITVQLPGMKFRPTVKRFEANRELRWLGHLGPSGVFDGEHYFQVQPLDGGRSRFVQGERFTGFLVPVFALFGIIRKTERGFAEMNQALKSRAESMES